MILHYKNKNIKYARELRKNMTKEEKHLWYDFLKDYPAKIVKQKPIGNYIVDFYCQTAKLVIELDGSQHFEDNGIEYDVERTDYLESLDLKVVRFSNYDINTNFQSVCANIDNLIQERKHE